MMSGTAAADNKVLETYDELAHKAGSIGQKQAELEHLDCLLHAFGNPKTNNDMESKLQEVRKYLSEKI